MGRPLSARATATTISSALGASGRLNSVESIKAVDKTTVEIKVHYKDADFLQKLANPHAIILPKNIAQENEFILDPIIGTGPWTIKRLRSGQMNL